MMKAGAFILTIILGVLLIQPLFAGLDTRLSGSCAQMKRATSSCCKATCHKQEPAKEKNDCGPNRCNPFMGCSAGNFYVDRKSTRLNSSHTVISYAVFCLKKKKNKTIIINK